MEAKQFLEEAQGIHKTYYNDEVVQVMEQYANQKLEEFTTEFVEDFEYKGSDIKSYLERFKENN